MAKHTWTPAIGDHVKLCRFDHYTSRGLNPWAWFKVLDLTPLHARLSLQDGPLDTGVEWVIPICEIEKPLGWEEVYDIFTQKENEDKVRAWMREGRGIAVWSSHDLSTAGRKMFTPGDRVKDGNPHWSVRLCEVVHDPERFRMMREEQRYDKPDKKEKHLWKYDRAMHGWYRSVVLAPLTGEEVRA